MAAKVLIHVADADLRSQLESLNPEGLSGNGVDELRYLFLTSQVELIDSADKVKGMKYHSVSDTLSIGVADADGEKCDRCWNHSVKVGESSDHPLICERCVKALDNTF